MTKSGLGDRNSVVCDAWRQQSHDLGCCAMSAMIEVVCNRAAVDEHQGPLIVRVFGIGVSDEIGMEDLGDSREARCPRGDLCAAGVHVRNVQDAAASGDEEWRGRHRGGGAPEGGTT